MCLSHKVVRQEQNLSLAVRSHTNWLGSMMYVKWMSRGEVVVVMVSNPAVFNLFPYATPLKNDVHIWNILLCGKQKFLWQKYISINETFILLKIGIQRVYRWVMINIDSAQDLSACTCETLLPLLPNMSLKLYGAAVDIEHFTILLVNCISNGQTSHSTPTSCLWHISLLKGEMCWSSHCFTRITGWSCLNWNVVLGLNQKLANVIFIYINEIWPIVQMSRVITRSLSPPHGASSGCGWRNGLRYGG